MIDLFEYFIFESFRLDRLVLGSLCMSASRTHVAFVTQLIEFFQNSDFGTKIWN